MEFDPSVIGPQECYRLLVGGVLPRPIAWISSLSATGVLNLAPYSFLTVASCNPPVLSVTQVRPRHRSDKDTLANLRVTRECVVNIVSADQALVMNATCADYPPEISEFAAVGVERVGSAIVAPDGVLHARVRFECRLREVIEVSALASGGSMMLLDVVHIHVDDEVLVQGSIAPNLLDPVGKMGGDTYTHTRDRFNLARPTL